ncbi:esterase/lipase family protein [Comamonas aquatica]|uniref:esterase/lipase family protein n=1 Tax=Comamonas aquatica TaxID=225991 RepID=UPI001B389436|nr:alpha/beta fold hydrolase [Comamonas aquatica]QTX20569.1 alpha/beta fold hydrolase [Comamonas aquatica]
MTLFSPSRWHLGLVLALATLLTGCAGVTVRTTDPATYLAERRSDVLTSGELSPAAQEALRVLDLDSKRCLADVPWCHYTIATATGLYDEQRMATLAELWILQARKAQQVPSLPGTRTPEDVQAWLEAARHAWAYLFFTQRKPSDRAFEDRQVQVRDYYNHAVQQAVTGLFALRGEAAPSAPITLGSWHLASDFSGVWLPANKNIPNELVPATSLRFSGLRNQYRRDGFGAELVAVFQSDADRYLARTAQGMLEGPPRPPYQESLFPAVTVVLNFAGQTLEEVLSTREVQLQAFDPYRVRQVELARTRVPLAGNFSSGYGLWLARSGFATQALRTLVGLSNGIVRPSIYLMQPYDPNRRTIVMLHGLASSPEAWINVANEVLGDENLRRNYQIWQVYYPTNAPLALNNQAIRQALQRTLQHFDPQGTARASQDITLVGHSMGGVLARLMVSSTQGQVLASITDTYGLDPDQLDEQLRPFVEFEPVPQVSSAIFIAAPHRGTDFANNRIARWVSNLITLPFSMVEQFADLTRQLAHASPRIGKDSLLRIPNSIDNLSDADEYVRLMANLPISPRVRYHSIIGNDTPNLPLADSSDGIVPYRSAHLEGAASELIVPFSHSVQEHPRAIVEIRRILHNQLLPSNAPSKP